MEWLQLQGAERLARETLALVQERCRQWCAERGLGPDHVVDVETGEVHKR